MLSGDGIDSVLTSMLAEEHLPSRGAPRSSASVLAAASFPGALNTLPACSVPCSPLNPQAGTVLQEEKVPREIFLKTLNTFLGIFY